MATFELTTTAPTNLVAGDILTCAYNGSYTAVMLPAGIYTIECYGAQGGGTSSSSTNGGKGGYSKGTITFEEETTVYLYVGGQGQGGGGAGGFNGGANATSTYSYGGGGGGATDVRIGGTALSQRIMVAGGGGGASYLYSTTGSASVTAAGGTGGGTSGGNGQGNYIGNTITVVGGGGGTSTAGGATGYAMSTSRGGSAGSLGVGGTGGDAYASYSNRKCGTGGGGGGYYGGGGGSVAYVASARLGASGAGGGSGYISSQFTDTLSSNGSRSGNGYIQITVVEITVLSKTITYYKVNNAWKEASAVYCRANGQWKETEALMFKLNGEWVGGASDSSIMGDIYPIFNLGSTILSKGTIADYSSGEPYRGYTISEAYGIEVYSGQPLGNSGSGGITLMPIGWTSTGACNITISDISESGRLYIGAYGINNDNVVNGTNIQLVVKNDSNTIASYDLTYVTASKMHTIEVSNPGTISIELSAYGEYVVESIHGFITHISYQAMG